MQQENNIIISKTYNFAEGEFIYINKPYNWTSFDVVNKIKNCIKYDLGLKDLKIGHTGTLDPLATGLLILCTGKFTKKIEEFKNFDKEYTGTITIGASTISGDLEKPIDQTFDISNITNEQIFDVASKFKGEMQQTAPSFSAKKINGKRAYMYARKGKSIDITPSTINISKFEIESIKLPDINFRISCSKGTYIRTIAVDFGNFLNNGAYLQNLCRTRIGDITLEQSYELEDFVNIIKNIN